MSIHIVANVLTVIGPRAESYQLQLYWRGLEKANLFCDSMWVCTALTLARLCGAHSAKFDTNRSSFSRNCSFEDPRSRWHGHDSGRHHRSAARRRNNQRRITRDSCRHRLANACRRDSCLADPSRGDQDGSGCLNSNAPVFVPRLAVAEMAESMNN